MNTVNRLELERVKQRQVALEEHVSTLGQDIQRLELRLLAEPLAAEPLPIFPAEIVPLTEPAAPASALALPPLPSAPPPLPILPSAFAETFDVHFETAPVGAVPPVIPQIAQPPSPGPVAPPTPTPTAPAEVKEKTPFELRIGKNWLAPIGIVVLLTGLVFLGNYAFGHMGAVGKVALLYSISGLLLGLGAWWQRRTEKEAMRNYAQVLFSGGLASVYFTTYAAHYLPSLQVIGSAFVDGLLLLAWAGFMVWVADRKKSQLLALFGTGLAYYTSAITDIGTFTLGSNLILTAASVFFLIRNRWTTLSIVSLVATYAGFGWWRFYHHGFLGDVTFAQLQMGNVFLFGYWTVFTAAVFLSRSEKLTHAARATFASLNNGAFFSLVVLSMFHQDHGNFWKFCLGFGALLIGLSAAARRFLQEETATKNAYLVQGLLMVTVGFVAHFTGLKLALILAAESVVLLMLGLVRQNQILQAGAFLTSALAVLWGVRDLHALEPRSALLGGAVSGFLLWNSLWSGRREAEGTSRGLRPIPGWFAAWGIFMGLATVWEVAPQIWRYPLLALGAVLGTATFRLGRVREIPLLSQSLLVVAQLASLTHLLPVPWWNPAALIAVTLLLSRWWQRQTTLGLPAWVGQFFRGLFALATVAMVYFWLHPNFEDAPWLGYTSLLALAFTAYGLVTREWFLAGSGQFFLAVSIWEFVRQLLDDKPDWLYALAPIGTLLLMVFTVAEWLGRKYGGEEEAARTLHEGARIYRWVATILTLWWLHAYIPAREIFWVTTALAAVIFVLGGWRKSREAFLFSAAIFGFGLFRFVFQRNALETTVYLPNLLAILTIAALQQLARRQPARFALPAVGHGLMVVPAGLGLWLLLTRWLETAHYTPFASLAWTLLAIAALGAALWLEEKLWRSVAYALLGVALFHVVAFDVWKHGAFWPHSLPILAVLVLQQLARRFPARYELQSEAQTLLVLAGGLSLWLFVSRWTILQADGKHFFLTMAWAGLALVIFGAGFCWRERLYRWLGLSILACALTRIFASDVWHLETIYRIVSFMALGGVLLVLGYLYNRYQEKIREWM